MLKQEDERCKEEKIKFKLEFSYGIIQKTEEMKNIPDILETADAKMYENKKAKRK